VRPSTPVTDGAEVELKLVEVGLHDPTAAVGKLEGDYEVVVADASKLVGKKVKATIGRALDGVAFATVADGQAVAAAPITFEAEAEKPMRASRSTKKPAAEVEVAEPDELDLEADESPVEEVVEDAAEPTAEEEAADGQPKKKRTRRGTRGGRGRTKPAAAAAAGSDADAPGNGRPAAPRIHVPPADLEEPAVEEATADVEVEAVDAGAETVAGDGAAPKKKRSRRGSRGGRKRKKPAAAGAGEDAAAPEDAGVAEPASEDGVPEYVPMSEWIEDFDASRPA
jgi:hypothetical protein